MTKLAIGLGMLLVVACGSIAAESKQSEPAAVGEVVQAQDTGDVEALLQRVADLEARLDSLRWTEADVIAIARQKVWEDLRNCPSDTTRSGLGPCDLYLADLMKGLTPTASAFGRHSLSRVILTRGKWFAVYEPENIRWRVTVVVQDSSGYRLPFYVYERTGLVEGTGPARQ